MGTTPYAAGTNVSETVGGKEYGRAQIFDANGTDAVGLVTASPAANTWLGRLKAIVDAVLAGNTSAAAIVPATRIFDITPSDSVQVSPAPRAIRIKSQGNLVVKGTDNAAVTIAVTAGEQFNFTPTFVMAATSAGVVGLA